MNHKGTKKIETERLVLRAFSHLDAQDMYKNWATNENVTRFLRWKPHPNIDLTKKLCEIWEKDSQKLNSYLWVIVDKITNQAIGSVGLVDIDEEKKSAEFGYCLSESYWGKGLMKEAMDAVLTYLEPVGFVRLFATCNVKNANSAKVLSKCGFEHEGILRKFDFDNEQNLVDVMMFSKITE